ncbi:acyl-CoA dehydrogenase family protein [Saccharopolyspora sp. HNM0986]|uniref:acyl-CoA dehydrogenase family protein n=1 Tax=Saccharopolyspora galaxeae TaxID=2781241 RepID=UPI00190D0662|nr:acyl-CoA dehydrogenase family protein [Saccharopolyspora sp. HNM0986]MBK0866547.1 acyl-CoA dehydrogenase family protein [Saccharopolyspora sp. HNM0986]
MDLTDSAQEAAFRREVREWLGDNLTGEFARARGLGGPGREHEAFDVRLAWDRHLAAAGWTCLGWPEEFGGRGASIAQQVIFHEEYAKAGAPVRVGHIGEELIGPTIIAFGTEQQQRRFLPPIVGVRELWCQGYSEPGAGSDLANLSTAAHRDGSDWVVHGQKIWTSHAHVADWCFLLARTDPAERRHRGLSYLLVPMDSAGIEVRPIVQLTGTSEFNEVFFDGARTDAANVVGEPGDGWRVAMGTLGFERGIGTVDQQVVFRRELESITELARSGGALDDPVLRDKISRAWIGLEIMRFNALRTLTGVAEGTAGPEASIAKLYWANFHRGLGELAVEVAGACGLVAPDGELDERQRLFLFTRADTIYGGSDEIQRNIIAERVLGLPKEARP